MARTTRWARRSLATPPAPGQLRFGIGQGGVHVELRRAHLAELRELPFDGFALGGLGVGEAPEVMHGVIAEVAGDMPADRPRYLMGVGYERDIVAAVRAGVDMFDCVLPTRNGRNALACKVLVKDVAPKVTVEPIRGLPVLKDLIVDMEPFFAGYRKVLPFLINDDEPPERERYQSQEDRERFDDTTKCILCAACTTSASRSPTATPATC